MANDELHTLLALLQGVKDKGQNLAVPAMPAIAREVQSLLTPGFSGTNGRGNPAQATRMLGGGLSLLPVIGGLLRLFGVGKKQEPPPPIEPFALPPPIQAEAGLSRSGETFLIDRGASDQIRRLPEPQGVAAVSARSANDAAPRATAGTEITVNVQAMDSQSFLDRRDDIARAVREAMLHSHSVNDVVNDI